MLLAVASLEWLLKNLNYTKSNKAISSIFSITRSQVVKESKTITIVKTKRI